MRSRILRGVYEENLVMLRGGQGRSRPCGRYLPRRVLVPAFIFLFVFLVYNHDSGTLSSSDFFENPIRHFAGLSVPKSAPVDLERAAELKNLEYNSSVPLRRMFGLGVQRIVIDPGHGGTDKGTVGKSGTKEKDITLDIAKRLRACLYEEGFQNIYMTRSEDSFISLNDRVEFAREVKADLFISIHVNWLPNTPVDVIETFYFGPSTDRDTLLLADQENKGSSYGLSDFRELVERLGKTMKLQESRKLAESIQESLFQSSKEHNPNVKDNGVKRAPFVVLIGPEVPSVLSEVSCLSNAGEEVALNSESHRKNIAEYLAAGIISYLHMGAQENDRKQ